MLESFPILLCDKKLKELYTTPPSVVYTVQSAGQHEADPSPGSCHSGTAMIVKRGTHLVAIDTSILQEGANVK